MNPKNNDVLLLEASAYRAVQPQGASEQETIPLLKRTGNSFEWIKSRKQGYTGPITFYIQLVDADGKRPSPAVIHPVWRDLRLKCPNLPAYNQDGIEDSVIGGPYGVKVPCLQVTCEGQISDFDGLPAALTAMKQYTPRSITH